MLVILISPDIGDISVTFGQKKKVLFRSCVVKIVTQNSDSLLPFYCILSWLSELLSSWSLHHHHHYRYHCYCTEYIITPIIILHKYEYSYYYNHILCNHNHYNYYDDVCRWLYIIVHGKSSIVNNRKVKQRVRVNVRTSNIPIPRKHIIIIKQQQKLMKSVEKNTIQLLFSEKRVHIYDTY